MERLTSVGKWICREANIIGEVEVREEVDIPEKMEDRF